MKALTTIRHIFRSAPIWRSIPYLQIWIDRAQESAPRAPWLSDCAGDMHLAMKAGCEDSTTCPMRSGNFVYLLTDRVQPSPPCPAGMRSTDRRWGTNDEILALIDPLQERVKLTKGHSQMQRDARLRNSTTRLPNVSGWILHLLNPAACDGRCLLEHKMMICELLSVSRSCLDPGRACPPGPSTASKVPFVKLAHRFA